MHEVSLVKKMTNLSIFSFGGGRQGTAIAVMLARHPEVFQDLGYPLPQHIIFADTGEEPPSVIKNVEFIRILLESAGYKFHIVSKGRISETARGLSTLPLYTRPPHSQKKEIGMLSRQCTEEYKIKPIKAKTRELLGLQKGQRVPKDTNVDMWLGISLDEVQRAKASPVKWQTCRYPLVDLRITASVCIAYVEKELKYTPPKSACYFCPMRSSAGWQNMSIEDPRLFERAVKFDKKIRTSLKTKSPAYVHRWGVPLEEAVTPGQLPLFPSNRSGGCDSGYCFS